MKFEEAMKWIEDHPFYQQMVRELCSPNNSTESYDCPENDLIILSPDDVETILRTHVPDIGL